MVVRWVLWAAPLGVFALVLAVTAKVGFDLIGALGAYIALQSGIYLLVTLLVYVVAIVFGGEAAPLRQRHRPGAGHRREHAVPLASLPVMLECAHTRLGYRDGPVRWCCRWRPRCSASPARCSTWSPARSSPGPRDRDLDRHMLAVVPLTVVVSMGSVGLPGQVSFMATNVPVAQALGLPIELLGLLWRWTPIPDVFSTIGNVTADLGATAVVEKRTATWCWP